MRRFLIIAGLASFVAAAGAAFLPAEPAAAARVTFVGNAGYLVEAGGKKVLIDGLFKGFASEYLLPQAVQDALAAARPPFDGIDLILVTHNHGDHFDAGLTREHMRNNPRARLASTAQVTAQLAEFGDRVLTLAAAASGPVSAEIAGIAVQAIYLSHGQAPAGREETINNAYLVTAAGTTFFHTGDLDISRVDMSRPLSPGRKIDLAFVAHFFCDGNPLTRKFIGDWIAARHLLPIHYHFTTPAYDRERVLNFYPQAVIFEKELQTWTVPGTKIP